MELSNYLLPLSLRRCDLVYDHGLDLIAISHIASCKVRAFPSFYFPVSEILIPHHMSVLDQWSRSYHYFASSHSFVMPDQRSKISLLSTTQIQSWFHISRFHRIEHLLFFYFPIKEMPITHHVSSASNIPQHTSIQRSRSILSISHISVSVVSCFLDSFNSRYPKLQNGAFVMLWSITTWPS
jgi:hypothetical protein